MAAVHSLENTFSRSQQIRLVPPRSPLYSNRRFANGAYTTTAQTDGGTTSRSPRSPTASMLSSRSSVRRPKTIEDTSRLMNEKPPEVPRLVVERAFNVWDQDRDEYVDLEDLERQIASSALRISSEELKHMFEDALTQFDSGHAPPPIVGHSFRSKKSHHQNNTLSPSSDASLSDEEDVDACRKNPEIKNSISVGKHKRLRVDHVVHAISSKRIQVKDEQRSKAKGKSRTKQWANRPYVAQWLMIIESSLPGESILAPPSTTPFNEAIMTFRERTGFTEQGFSSPLNSPTSFHSAFSPTSSRMSTSQPRPNSVAVEEAKQQLSQAILKRRPRSRAHGAIPNNKPEDFNGTRGLAWTSIELSEGRSLSDSGNDVIVAYLKNTESSPSFPPISPGKPGSTTNTPNTPITFDDKNNHCDDSPTKKFTSAASSPTMLSRKQSSNKQHSYQQPNDDGEEIGGEMRKSLESLSVETSASMTFEVKQQMDKVEHLLEANSHFAARTASIQHMRSSPPKNATARFRKSSQNMPFYGSPASIDQAVRASFGHHTPAIDGMWRGDGGGGESRSGDNDACLLRSNGQPVAESLSNKSGNDGDWQRTFFPRRTNEEWRKSAVHLIKEKQFDIQGYANNRVNEAELRMIEEEKLNRNIHTNRPAFIVTNKLEGLLAMKTRVAGEQFGLFGLPVAGMFEKNVPKSYEHTFREESFDEEQKHSTLQLAPARLHGKALVKHQQQSQQQSSSSQEESNHPHHQKKNSEEEEPKQNLVISSPISNVRSSSSNQQRKKTNQLSPSTSMSPTIKFEKFSSTLVPSNSKTSQQANLPNCKSAPSFEEMIHRQLEA